MPTPRQPSTPAFAVVSAILLACFSLPLWHLAQFSLGNEVYSYLILIPLVSAYFVWQRRGELTSRGEPFPLLFGILVILAGGALAVAYLGWGIGKEGFPLQDRIALSALSLVVLAIGCALLFLSRETLRVLAFPLLFLLLLAPMPTRMEAGVETFLQHGSAAIAHWMLEAAGMTVFRDGTNFRLPGFSMEVAPECSGIRSTLALFITSIVAAQQFLHSSWRRAILVAVVVPIALVRNGLRVFTIGELCVQIGPEMIDSWIHRRGGPVFFVLSLIPFSLILYWLVRSERRSPGALAMRRPDAEAEPAPLRN